MYEDADDLGRITESDVSRAGIEKPLEPRLASVLA